MSSCQKLTEEVPNQGPATTWTLESPHLLPPTVAEQMPWASSASSDGSGTNESLVQIQLIGKTSHICALQLQWRLENKGALTIVPQEAVFTTWGTIKQRENAQKIHSGIKCPLSSPWETYSSLFLSPCPAAFFFFFNPTDPVTLYLFYTSLWS